jgi:vacuolar-type H+-ATPase subunit D/Vma8
MDSILTKHISNMENTNHQLRILIIDTLAKSLMFSTVNSRLLIRVYLTSINLPKTSSKIEYDGSGISFANNVSRVLESMTDYKSIIKHIVELAIALEDIDTVKKELKDLLEAIN